MASAREAITNPNAALARRGGRVADMASADERAFALSASASRLAQGRPHGASHVSGDHGKAAELLIFIRCVLI